MFYICDMESQKLTPVQQDIIITKTLLNVLLTYKICKVGKKEVPQSEHIKLVIESFNRICQNENVNVMDRTEMMPLVLDIAQGTLSMPRYC